MGWLARGPRARRQQRHRGRARDFRGENLCGWTVRTSPICSGPSGVAAAASAIVTAIELELYPTPELYAGAMF